VKIVRVPFAVSLALLAAAPAQAAVAPPPPPKPPAEGAGDPDRDAWRAQGLPLCMSEMLSAEGVGAAGEVQATCECALDRFAASQGGRAPPPIEPDRARAQLAAPLAACEAEQRTGDAAALARRLAQPPQPLVPPADSKPSDETAPGQAEAPKPSLPSFRTWLGGLPAWLGDSGLPAWAWAVLAFLGFMLLRGLFRRESRSDLIGPPPGTRLDGRANPPAPPRADPPQRS
jgi:hypothetical protein